MRTRPLIAVAALTLAIAVPTLSGCSSSDSAGASSTAVQGPVAAATAPAAPTTVDAVEFSKVVTSPGVTVIDVRRPDEFAAGHIDGAINYNVESPDFANQIAGLDKAGIYAVYCHSGRRSQIAAGEMQGAGINGIYDLGGGIGAWQSAGLPLVQ